MVVEKVVRKAVSMVSKLVVLLDEKWVA